MERGFFVLEETLYDLVRCSQCIVIATQENPPWHIREIPYSGGDSENVPPYKQTVFHYRVIKTLFGSDLTDHSIEVIEADTGTHQNEHFKYHAMNMTMCIAWQYYASKYDVNDADPRILFLCKENGELAHVNHTGYEGVQAEDEVLSTLSDMRPDFRNY
jgi:hypothetical protein